MTSEPLHPVTTCALNACGSEDEEPSESTGSSGAAAAGAGGTAVAKTSDIPEGGGKILNDHKVVVTQPTAGTFKAFSYECTHQGCPVTGVADGAITCPCHNSRFSIEDGSVQKGPATQPLPAREVKVEGDSITLA